MILNPNDSQTAIRVLNSSLQKTQDEIDLAKETALITNRTVKSLDATVNGTIELDPYGQPIPVRDKSGETIYDDYGEPIFQRKGDGILVTKLDVDLLNADQGAFKRVIAENVDTDTITANVIESEVMKTTFADIDFANVKNLTGEQLDVLKSNIGVLLASVGLITTAVISEGHVTGYLDSVQINANSIKTGTLDVERLIITDEQGQKHLIHYDESGKAVSEKLDGNVIKEQTITADKLVAHSITSNEITAENIIGSGGWINLARATFNFSNADTGHGISWDGRVLSINGGLTVASIADFDSAVADKTKDFQTATQVDSKINNIKIGARNLTSNISSNWADGSWSIPSVGGDTTIIDYSGRISLVEPVVVTPDTEYWVKVYGEKPALVVFRQLDSEGKFLRTTNNISDQAWTSPSDCYFIAVTMYENVSLEDLDDGLVRLKLEKGNKPTDWTPAPEDVDTEIDVAISDSNEAMQLTINDIGGTVTLIGNDVGEMQNQITENASNITNIGDRVDGIDLIKRGYVTLGDGTMTIGDNNSVWKLVATATGIDLVNDTTVVGTFSKHGDGSQLKATNSELSTIRFRSSERIGTLGLIATSNNHVTFKEVR